MIPGRSTPRFIRTLALAGVLFSFSLSLQAAQDVVTVGSVTASGGTVDVPVYINDVSSTPLGLDQPVGSRIQSFSIKVTYAPAAAVQSVTFARAGVTAALTPVSEFMPATTGAISLLDAFQESTNPIPLTLNAGQPGNVVAHLTFTLAASAAPGTTISLSLDPSLTQLTDAGGTAATKETASNGTLALVDGAITIPPITVSIVPSATVPLGSDATLVVSISSARQTSTSISLTSSNTAVALVPAMVTVPAGQITAEFPVTGVALGMATITASFGSSFANASVTVADVPPPCVTPAAPILSVPATVTAGSSYSVSWASIGSASEYAVDEATDSGFATVTSRTVTSTSVSFSHSGANVRYYYRVRARNHAGTCDLFSGYSASASVLISAAPVAATKTLAVVGSVPGNFGAYFRTSLQMHNPKTVTISGRIVFHTSGASGTSADPFLAYSILPGKTLAYTDILPAMGIASGIGSVDLVSDLNSTLPVALARVFNDAGDAGTTGLAEEAMGSDQALSAGSTGVLLAPNDVKKFRLNVGVRTFEQGATISFVVRDKDGVVRTTVMKTYDPTFFAQTSSGGILDGFVLSGGETITIDMKSGSAIVYGSTTDNITNDPSIQFARRIE